MIEGFEEITFELTDRELPQVPFFVKGLRLRLGESMAVKNEEMVEAMVRLGYKCSPARVRKIIHHIRINKLVLNLVATSKGYYVENDPQKKAKYVKSLEQRIRSIEQVRDSFLSYQMELL